MDLGRLKESQPHQIEVGYTLEGLCHSGENLFTVEWRLASDYPSLCMYNVRRNEMRLLDQMELSEPGEWLHSKICSLQPCIDHHSQRVFVPCGDGGVVVVRFDRKKLKQEKVLRSVKSATNVVVKSPDTICVVHNDGSDCSANFVNIENDTVTRSLKMPKGEAFQSQRRAGERLAVLGDALIIYIPEDCILVYRQDARATRLAWPEGMSKVSSIRTDKHGHILLTDHDSHTVFILDSSGKVNTRVEIQTKVEIWDCAVVCGQLWVACNNGNIIVMSPESPQ